jgi:hypothetical protein
MNELEDLDSDVQEGMRLSEEEFDSSERKKLINSLFYWLNNLSNSDICSIASSNILEMQDYLPRLTKYLKYYKDDQMIQDLKIILSLLVNLRDKIPSIHKKLVDEAYEDVKRLLEEIREYPFPQYYSYYEQYYKNYPYYPKTKRQKFEEAIKKTEEEIAEKESRDNELSKWDVVLASLLLSNEGNPETFRKKYIEEAKTLDETILEACQSIKDELNGISEEAKRQLTLTQCLEKEGKELEDEKEKLKKFREQILDKWLLEESRKWKGEA